MTDPQVLHLAAAIVRSRADSHATDATGREAVYAVAEVLDDLASTLEREADV